MSALLAPLQRFSCKSRHGERFFDGWPLWNHESGAQFNVVWPSPVCPPPKRRARQPAGAVDDNAVDSGQDDIVS